MYKSHNLNIWLFKYFAYSEPNIAHVFASLKNKKKEIENVWDHHHLQSI